MGPIGIRWTRFCNFSGRKVSCHQSLFPDEGDPIEQEKCREQLQELEQAKGGDLAAQEDLIVRYQQRIAGFIYTFLGDPSVVEDLAQQIFVKMLQGLHQLKDPERFEVWLFRLARNACLNHLRAEKWRRRFTPFTDRHEIAAEPETNPEDEARLAWLERAIRTLPAPDRELLALLQDDTLSYEDLARITGTTVSAVKSRLFRAREQLKQKIPNEL